MNVNITGIYDNTVIVDSNLFDDVRLLQTGLSSLSDTLFSVVEGLPYQYANRTRFTTLSNDYESYKITNNSRFETLSDDYEAFKITSNSYLSILDTDIQNLTTNISVLNVDISNNYVNTTTLSTLTTAVDDQFETTITYIDDKATEQHEYTDQEVEALRNEGYVQEAITQILAWATSDEGKRFRKKLWTRISSKWTSFTGGRPFTELIDDVTHATSDELDDLLKVYRYDLNNAGIRTDPIIGKDIVMKGDTYIYDGHLYLTGDIRKGTFNATSGTWTEQKNLNNYFVMKGVKNLHCLDINNTTELLELHYDDLDFELGPAPYYYLKLKYPIHSVHPTQCLSIDPSTKQLEFNINTDYFDFDSNSRRTLKPKFDANGVDSEGPLFIDFSTRKLRAKYNDTLQVNASKELGTTFNCVGLKTNGGLSLDATTKLLQYNLNPDYFNINVSNQLSPVFELKGVTAGQGLSVDATTKLLKMSTSINQFFVNPSLSILLNANGGIVDNIAGIGNGLQIKLADTSLSLSASGLQVSTTYKSELQQIKTDTQTFKTQAETAKTEAETAKTQAEAAKTTATSQASTATSQATIATSQATTATSQATIATSQATIATTQAAAATASAGAASGSASAALASAGAAGGAAAAAIAASLAFIPGPKGDRGDKGDPGEPSLFKFRYPLIKSYDQYVFVPELYIDPLAYVETTSFSTFSTSVLSSINNLNNKTNFSNLLISDSSTLLSSLNVSGQSTLNNVNILGNLNVNGTTTIIDTLINNTSMNSLSVSGPSIYYSNVTLISSLNVSGSTRLNSATTLISTLNVSGTTILNNNTTLLSSLNVSGSTTLNNITTLLSSLNVSGTTLLNSAATLLSSLNVSGTTTINNATTLISTLNVSGTTTLNNSTTLISTLNVSGSTILNNNTTLISTLNVSGITILNNATTLLSSLNVVGNIIGSGTALTNLNYNAITNKPDLTQYATNTTLNNFSTSSILSINNLNTTTNTIFNNLNSLSTNSILSINNLNATSTTLLSMINSLTGGSTISNLNSLSTNSTLSINNLNATSTTIFNKTNFSSLSVVGDINTSGLSVFNTLSGKQNNLNFSNPLLNTSNTISLKYDNTKLNVDASGNLTVVSGASQWTTTGTSIFYNTGNVGIGTSSPSYMLDVYTDNSSINNAIRIRSNAAREATLILDRSGTLWQILNKGTGFVGTANNLSFSSSSKSDILEITQAGNVSLSGQLIAQNINLTTSTSGNNVLFIKSTNASANNCIQIQNNGAPTAYLGVGGSAFGGNYANNFFIESASTSIIFNTNGRISGSTPNMIINTAGNVGIGVLNPSQILQVGNAGRLRISNGESDYSLLGTIDTDGATNTRIVVSGKTRGFGLAGQIDYVATSGNHIFHSDGTSEKFIVANNGNLYVNSGLLNINAANVSSGGAKGIIFRKDYELPNNNNYNCSILTYDHDANGFCDGLSINGWDGISFCTGSNTRSERMRITTAGRVGIANANPQSMLHLGNSDVAGSNPAIVFGKRLADNTGNRNAFISYTDNFIFCIGDNGNTNGSSNLITQLGIHYAAPSASLVVGTNGYVAMQYGFGGLSDERIKTNIKTIENALDKTLLLRGVEYNDFRIEPERKRIGLIAQETELIIPEVVRTGDDGLKSIEYQNLVGLLIEAVKQLNNKVLNLENIIKNNNLN